MRIPIAKRVKREEVLQLINEEKGHQAAEAEGLRLTWNKSRSLRRESDRVNPMGVLQLWDGEFEGTKGPPSSGTRMYFDTRCNVWAVKFLCNYWGTGAYSTDVEKGGSPIQFMAAGKTYTVHCHIDVATPREDFLVHGGVEGPHIVVSGYNRDDFKTVPQNINKNKKDTTGQPLPAVFVQVPMVMPALKLCIALDAQEVYELALFQFRECYRARRSMVWPQFILDKISTACVKHCYEVYDSKQKK